MNKNNSPNWLHNYLSLFIVNMVVMMSFHMLNPNVTKYATSLHISGTMLGIISGVFSAAALVLMSGIAAHLRGGRRNQLGDNDHSAVVAAVFTSGQSEQFVPVFCIYAGVIEGQGFTLAD